MRSVLFSIIAILSISEPAAAQTKVLDGKALFAEAYRLQSYKPRDQFDSPPNFALLKGREFKADLPLTASGPNNKICVGIPWYDYDAHVGLSIHYGDNESDLRAGLKPEFSLGCTFNRRRERRSNAFGASVAVDVMDQNYIAIEAVNLIPSFLGSTYTMQMPGDVARSLVSATHLRITGTISTEGDPIECHRNSSPATLDSKSETNWFGCHISANVTALDLVVNTKTGEVVTALRIKATQPN